MDLAIYVRELYTRYGSTISNRENFANVFPMLTLITVVIIFVVKSSLTLSLGLVGALSIVRFRTAIKSARRARLSLSLYRDRSGPRRRSYVC